MLWVGVLEEFADDGALVEGLVVVLECWDETSWVEGEEGIGFMVGVYLVGW